MSYTPPEEAPPVPDTPVVVQPLPETFDELVTAPGAPEEFSLGDPVAVEAAPDFTMGGPEGSAASAVEEPAVSEAPVESGAVIPDAPEYANDEVGQMLRDLAVESALGDMGLDGPAGPSSDDIAAAIGASAIVKEAPAPELKPKGLPVKSVKGDMEGEAMVDPETGEITVVGPNLPGGRVKVSPKMFKENFVKAQDGTPPTLQDLGVSPQKPGSGPAPSLLSSLRMMASALGSRMADKSFESDLNRWRHHRMDEASRELQNRQDSLVRIQRELEGSSLVSNILGRPVDEAREEFKKLMEQPGSPEAVRIKARVEKLFKNVDGIEENMGVLAKTRKALGMGMDERLESSVGETLRNLGASPLGAALTDGTGKTLAEKTQEIVEKIIEMVERLFRRLETALAPR